MDIMTDPSLTEEEKRELMRMYAGALRGQQRQSGPPPGAMQVAQQFMGGESGGGSAMASPWAALAAGIALNEGYQRKSGNRPEDFGDQIVEGLYGKALERDFERYFGDGGEVLGKLGNPEGQLQLLKEPEKLLKFWEWF